MDHTGFRCEHEEGEPMFKPFVLDSSVAWSEYLQMTADCALPNGTLARNARCPCDISAGTWFEDPERQIVQFAPAVMVSDFRIITHVNNTHSKVSPMLFVDGFNPLIWVFLSLLMLCFAFVKSLDPYYNPPHSETREEKGLERLDEMDVSDTSRRKTSRRKKLQRVLLKSWGLYQARKAIFSTSTFLTYSQRLCSLHATLC